MQRKIKFKLIVGTVVVAGLAIGAVFIQKQTSWVHSEPYTRTGAEASTLVVHYSRTGNTQGAAHEVARFFDAATLQIDAPQYGLTFKGQQLAAAHADEHVRTTPIQHDPVDLGEFDLVVLCAPTWWYRPAVPIWSFVESHDFEGASVFLVTTGNSTYKQPHIDAFGRLVAERQGTFLGHVFIRRGRFLWQKTPSEVREEVRAALAARGHLWQPRTVNQ